MNTYTTRDEAIEREIVAVIEAGDATASQYDVQAIAAEVLGGYDEGYAVVADDEEFWAAVARHAL